ncbi:hypothetical protein BC835DRAFT_368708 [Cytidiella melzeri]|nr:hypothetical protein BC835DRAFT_368708 [Cytidiella melzeri]
MLSCKRDPIALANLFVDTLGLAAAEVGNHQETSTSTVHLRSVTGQISKPASTTAHFGAGRRQTRTDSCDVTYDIPNHEEMIATCM